MFCAFIPARSGSQRLPNKNMLTLNGQTLIQRAITLSLSIPDIESTFIITDSHQYESHALFHGASSLGLRPSATSTHISPDREWLSWAYGQLMLSQSSDYKYYIILRPTSPFRSKDLILGAINLFLSHRPTKYHSLRCVTRVTEHPGKMWVKGNSDYMHRLFPFKNDHNVYWCDSPTQQLPQVYVQNACIEIGVLESLLDYSFFSTSGEFTIMYERNGYDVFDINTKNDYEYAQYLCAAGLIS